MDSVWTGLCLILVINIWESSAITNKDNRRSKAPEEAVRHFRHIENPTTYINTDWEIGLREAANQALLREKYHAPNLRDRLLRAPLIGKQDTATPFGDVAIVARGQLYVTIDGDFVFIQDAYQNDCEGCHSAKRRCTRCEQVFRSPQDEQLVALWTVKRLRHRDYDNRYRYETEYTVSPVEASTYGPVDPSNHHHFDYAIPGHVFVIKHHIDTRRPHVPPPVIYNQRVPHTHFRPEVLIGIDPDGHKHFLHSYPGFYTTLPVHPTDQSTNDPKEVELYKHLVDALASKTSTTQKFEAGPHRFSLNNYGNNLYTTEDSFTPLVQLPTGEMVPLTDVTFSATSSPQITNGPVRFPETYPQEKITKPIVLQMVPTRPTDLSTTEVVQSVPTTKHVIGVTQPLTTVHYFAPAEEEHPVTQGDANVDITHKPTTPKEEDGADFLFPIEETTATPKTTKGYEPAATTTKFTTSNIVGEETQENWFPEPSPSPTRQSKVYHATFSANETSFATTNSTTPTSSTYKFTSAPTTSEATPTTTKATSTAAAATFKTTPTTIFTTTPTTTFIAEPIPKTTFTTTFKTTPIIKTTPSIGKLTTPIKNTNNRPSIIKLPPPNNSIIRTPILPKFATTKTTTFNVTLETNMFNATPKTTTFNTTPTTTKFTVPITTARKILPPVLKINTTVGPTDLRSMSSTLKTMSPTTKATTMTTKRTPTIVIFESFPKLTTSEQNSAATLTTTTETEVIPTSITTLNTTPSTLNATTSVSSTTFSSKTPPLTSVLTTLTASTTMITPTMHITNDSATKFDDNESASTTPSTPPMITELSMPEAPTTTLSPTENLTLSTLQGDVIDTDLSTNSLPTTRTEMTPKPLYKVMDQLQPPANETETTAEFSGTVATSQSIEYVTPEDMETTTMFRLDYPTFKTVMTSTTSVTTETTETAPEEVNTKPGSPTPKEEEETTTRVSTTTESFMTTNMTSAVSSTTRSIFDEFLEELEKLGKPLHKKNTQVDVNEDDIFGSAEEDARPTMATTMKITESEFAGELFGNRRRSPKMYVTEPSQTKGTKIIFSDFYEASTASMKNEEDDSPMKIDPLTSQSYATSISFKVNKKTKTTDDNRNYGGKTTISSESVTNTNSGERSDTETSTMSARDHQETKKAFDEAALQLVNHVRSINYLNAAKNSTARGKYKRQRTYVPKGKRKPKENNQ